MGPPVGDMPRRRPSRWGLTGLAVLGLLMILACLVLARRDGPGIEGVYVLGMIAGLGFIVLAVAQRKRVGTRR